MSRLLTDCRWHKRHIQAVKGRDTGRITYEQAVEEMEHAKEECLKCKIKKECAND